MILDSDLTSGSHLCVSGSNPPFVCVLYPSFRLIYIGVFNTISRVIL